MKIEIEPFQVGCQLVGVIHLQCYRQIEIAEAHSGEAHILDADIRLLDVNQVLYGRAAENAQQEQHRCNLPGPAVYSQQIFHRHPSGLCYLLFYISLKKYANFFA